MKSRHRSMRDNGLEFAIRVDTNPPPRQDVDVRTTLGDAARDRLLDRPGDLLLRLEEPVELGVGPH